MCPQCQRVMLKFRIAAQTNQKLDYCGHCDVVWIDKGEWELLAQTGLLQSVTRIFTDSWQHTIRKQDSMENEKIQLKKLFEESDLEEILRFRKWLNIHPLKHHILRILNKN